MTRSVPDRNSRLLDRRPDLRLTSYADVRDALRTRLLEQALYDAGAVVMADVLLTLHGPAHSARRRLENRLFRREVFAEYERGMVARAIAAHVAPAAASGATDMVPLARRVSMAMTAHIAGVDTAGVDTAGVDTAGVDTAGVDTAGVDTAGVDTAGADAAPRVCARAGAAGAVQAAADRRAPTAGADAAELAAGAALYRFVCKFSEGATMVHSTRDRDELTAEVAAALEAFDARFLAPSVARRRALLAAVAAGELDESALPRDVLTVLLRHEDELALPAPVLRREIAFYLQAGAHSTVNAAVHAMHELLGWLVDHPEDRGRARRDLAFVQRCVHEALRLHPASPVAWRRAVEPVRLRSGVEIPAGALVELDLAQANRDPEAFGADAAQFLPHRALPPELNPWGLSFGGGIHACIGAELDGGVPAREGAACPAGQRSHGTVASLVFALLAAGATTDPQRPPVSDAATTRANWASYPLVFRPVEALS
jgi:cytochrome P450